MKVVTRESRANEAAKVWKAQYQNKDGSWKYEEPSYFGQLRQKSKQEVIYDKLIALGANPDPDKVDEIIGNTSWTRVPQCSECDKETQSVILLHDKSDNVVQICGQCLLKALNIMEGEEVPA